MTDLILPCNVKSEGRNMLVLDNSTIKAVIDEYAKSEIQSEAEVRSKLVVPLLCALGYPSELRAEEFPVYGFGGRKKLPAKSADFLLFSDKEFGAHRNDTQKDKDWVQSHSLLIVEAKKPGEMPDSPGQAQFYTMWTKAVVYMVTDGCEIQAYCYSDISADYRIICCTTNELPYIENLGMLSFDNVRAIKEKEQVAWQECNALQNSTEYPVHIITDDAELNLPNETLAYIRNALGRNADGLSNVQLVAKYLNATDSFLQNDLRYDIPAYMIDIPRGEYKAKLYYDDFIFPIMTGKVIEFYCNDDSRYVFRSSHMMIVAILKGEKLAHFEIGFQVLDQTVDARVAAFSTIEKCLRSKSLRISIENTKNISISLPIRSPGKRWPRKQQLLAMLEFWTFGLSKLKEIEEYYEIKFKLAPLSGSDKVMELYDSIVFVYNGIMLNENCDITLPSSSFDDDIVIEEPFLCQENEPIPLQDRVIHGITFRPYRSAFLPCKISLSEIKKDDIVRLPGCCEYRIVETK